MTKRLSTADFQEYRKSEAGEGRVDVLPDGAWSKMAIVRIHRRDQPKVRCDQVYEKPTRAAKANAVAISTHSLAT